MRPALLRPPVLDRGRTSDFSGSSRVISTKSATDEPRRPGVVGLYLRIPMRWCPVPLCSQRLGERVPALAGAAEDLDRLARGQAHQCALGVLALAIASPGS